MTRGLLVGIGRIVPPEYMIAKQTAGKLWNAIGEIFGRVLTRLIGEIAKANPQFEFQTNSLGVAPAGEILGLAKHFRYDPNVNDCHQTVFLLVKSSDPTSRVVVALHSSGSRFKGLIVAVAYFQFAEGTPVPLSDDLFRISYQEEASAVDGRFRVWLEASLIRGLAEWRRTLL